MTKEINKEAPGEQVYRIINQIINQLREKYIKHSKEYGKEYGQKYLRTLTNEEVNRLSKETSREKLREKLKEGIFAIILEELKAEHEEKAQRAAEKPYSLALTKYLLMLEFRDIEEEVRLVIKDLKQLMREHAIKNLKQLIRAHGRTPLRLIVDVVGLESYIEDRKSPYGPQIVFEGVMRTAIDKEKRILEIIYDDKYDTEELERMAIENLEKRGVFERGKVIPPGDFSILRKQKETLFGQGDTL